MTGDVGKKHGRTVYLCQGCRRPLSAALVRQGRDTHDGCAAEAVRRFEVAQARREGIPVKLWRERRGEAPQEPVAHHAARPVTTAMRVARIYMRVSTEQQDIERQEEIARSARASGYYVAGVYREKASGARADRPELLRMISDLQPGEIVIAEKIDRISRLPLAEAERLVASIRDKGAVPGVVDLSELAADAGGVAKVVLESVQDMLLKPALQIARDDYEDRRERQRQGVELARLAGKYVGRKADTATHQRIIALRSGGHSIAVTAKLARCSQSQVKRVWALDQQKSSTA
jgi:DNA invertase Pin-like site-specific DNA recombinase